MRTWSTKHNGAALLLGGLFLMGCGRGPIVESNLPLKRVVIYRNGIAYFERGGQVEADEVHFRMRGKQVGDFLATLAVMEQGGSSVRSAAFPLKPEEAPRPRKPDDDDKDKDKESKPKSDLQTIVLSLDGKKHDLQVGYVAECPVWRPSYRLVVHRTGEADLQAWGIVQNLSGEDWKNVRLSLVAGAPLAFEAQLGVPVVPVRPVITDLGEVLAVVPRSETSLRQEPPAEPAPSPAAVARDSDEEDSPKSAAEAPSGRTRGGMGRAARVPAPRMMFPSAPPPPPPPPAPSARIVPSGPRDVRALAAVAVEGGTTRYDLPVPLTIPDQSATMVMMLSRKVPGEANFLYAPDGGVPDSRSHPFRVARFRNATAGMLERGPIAVFEDGSFLGQGMVDPLPAGATATVPFALERAIAVDHQQKSDETGERVAKIENGQLWIERDAVLRTTYRLRNGTERPIKLLVKHPRQSDTRLFEAPKETEDNVGTGTALVPTVVAPNTTGELIVDERATVRRWEDWFSPIANNAVKAYLADPRAPTATVAKLTAAWALRNEIVQKREVRLKLEREKHDLSTASEETRRNLKAIEKNRDADALRRRLTARLTEIVARLDELTKQSVENNMKLTELEVRFREAIREIKIEEPLPLTAR